MQPTAKTVMKTSLVTIPLGASLIQARELMDEKRFRHLPVVKSDGEIVGILSQRDLNFIKNPELIPVEYVMATPIVSADQNAPLRFAIFQMLQLKISSLLITGQEGVVVGIVTTDDLLGYLSKLLEDPKRPHFSISSLFDLQTVGEAIQQIADAGI